MPNLDEIYILTALGLGIACCIQTVGLLRLTTSKVPIQDPMDWVVFSVQQLASPVRPTQHVLTTRRLYGLLYGHLGLALSVVFWSAQGIFPTVSILLLSLSHFGIVYLLRLLQDASVTLKHSLCLALSAYAFFPNHEHIAWAGLYLIVGQATVAYFFTGLSKARSGSWRSGQRLIHIVAGSRWRNPALARYLSRKPLLARSMAWGTIVLELTVPVIWFTLPSLIPFSLAALVAFHLAIAFSLGIWSFAFIFPLSFPAVYFLFHV